MRGSRSRSASDEPWKSSNVEGRYMKPGNDREHRADDGRRVEAAVDGREAGLALAHLGDEHADRGGEGTDRGDDEREDQALLAERDLAKDERGDQGHRIGLEEVRGHAGAVADVVANVVRDGRRVAGVVLRDVVLDLANKVCANVGRLGEDAAANAHEHGEQSGTEAEALKHGRSVGPVQEHHESGSAQALANDAHANGAAGAERDAGAARAALVLGGGVRHAHVGAHREPHAHVPDDRGACRAKQEEAGAANADVHVAGQQEQQREHDHGEHREGAELAAQIRGGALLDRARDLLHLGGALVEAAAPPAAGTTTARATARR